MTTTDIPTEVGTEQLRAANVLRSLLRKRGVPPLDWTISEAGRLVAVTGQYLDVLTWADALDTMATLDREFDALGNRYGRVACTVAGVPVDVVCRVESIEVPA